MAVHDDRSRSGPPELEGWGDRLYRNLVERVPVVVYVDSNDQRPDSLYISPQVQTLFGHPPEAYLADPELWRRQTHPDDVATVAETWRQATADGRAFECEYRMIRPDGAVVWVRDSAVSVRAEDGRVEFWQGVISEITAVKQHEQELREAEARSRALVENLPAVVYLVAPDDDRRTLYVSPQVEHTLGYARDEWLAQPDIWMELLHPDDREPTLAAHDLHNRTGEPWSRDYRLIASDGRVLWFRDLATLVRDQHGAPLYWHGLQIDITTLKGIEEELRRTRDDLEHRVRERTSALEEANALMSLEIGERRRAEAELTEAERRYRLLAEQIPAVTYTWDLGEDQAEAYTSPRIQQLLGYTVAEWNQSRDFWMSRLHPDDRTAVLAATLRSETTGESFGSEYRYLHKDGHIVWVLDEAALVSRDGHGRPKLFQGFMLDITARRQAEAQARDVEERYRTLVEQLPAIVYVEEPSSEPGESHFRYLSPRSEQIVGYSAEELMADPSHLARMLHPDDRERVLSANTRAERSGEPFDQEYRVYAKDGHVVWLHSRAVLVRDAGGAPLYWHGVALDVSDRHRAEETLRAMETRYEDLASRTFRSLGIVADDPVPDPDVERSG
jgi:PAS domain S-box-containing protein